MNCHQRSERLAYIEFLIWFLGRATRKDDA